MMTVRIFTFLFFLGLPFFVHAGDDAKTNALLVELDKAIGQAEQFKKEKEQHIRTLKEQLATPGLSVGEQYDVCRNLTHAYEYYRCDSARQYALRQLDIAEASGDISRIIDSKIQLASVLFKAAMFDKSLELLGSIPKETLTAAQEIEYYKAYYETYVFWLEFYNDGYGDPSMTQQRDFYYEQFLRVLPQSTYEYASYYGIKYINTGQLDKAEKVLYIYLPKAKLGTRPYSILNSVLSFFYRVKGDSTKVKAHLALSALSDIRGNIMENVSLRELATLLYESGDINRANSYIKKSMEDANFYNARIRNFQTSKVLQIINRAYQTNQAAQQRKLEYLLAVISVLSFGLLIGIFLIIREVRKVSRAKKEISTINEQLRQNNLALAETNHIKEEYIGHFLELCSLYIEKIDKYQKKLYNKAKTSNADELFNTIKSTQFIEDERTEFYHKFDESFLKLFPDFVHRFNALLPEGEQVTLKPNEKLSTELRIFALIRLGITDSAKIAEFLNYSLATIYNYRSRYRNKSIVPRDEFENEIMKIGVNSF
ncbi:DUF6377 domain-containing protein [Parapedobacter defluvii]|uniref:DUF6377 domain-containing protein n=1 Tax=Parapedobacter defluvii TaxID=2045106 RepID=UPI003342C02F